MSGSGQLPGTSWWRNFLKRIPVVVKWILVDFFYKKLLVEFRVGLIQAIAAAVVTFIIGIGTGVTSRSPQPSEQTLKPISKTKQPLVKILAISWSGTEKGKYVLSGSVDNLGIDEVVWSYNSIIDAGNVASNFAPQVGPCAVFGTTFTCPVGSAGNISESGRTFEFAVAVVHSRAAAEASQMIVTHTVYHDLANIPAISSQPGVLFHQTASRPIG